MSQADFAYASRGRVSFCITCMGRLAHLQETLPRNLADNADHAETEFVILDYACPQGTAEWVLATFPREVASGRIRVFRHPDAQRFHIAHAKNMAHRLASGELLCNLDADNFTGPGFAAYVAGHLSLLRSRFLRGMVRGRVEHKGCGGRIAVPKSLFHRVGGYWEGLTGYGADDKEFRQRVETAGGVPVDIEERFLSSVRHGNAERIAHYDDKTIDYERTSRVLRERRTEVIANNGRYGCGRVIDMATGRAFELGPMPTRLFGIGWHRTGTSSLTVALVLLGLDARHWPVELIRQHGTEMRDYPSVLRNFSLTDLPVPVMYRELDAAFPNSKFILTTRATDAWLASVARQYEFNDYHSLRNRIRALLPRRQRLRDIRACRKAAYGVHGYDEALFRRRYEAHNAEVRDYFRDRPGDLLELDFSRGDAWPELCGFLGVPQPEIAFPQWNVTEEREEKRALRRSAR